MYYKPCKELNKVNLCWVFSEGQRGHEIQSSTLAQAISQQTTIFQFNLRQPWLTFAPRLLPKFDLGINWSTTIPNTAEPPELIITSGRKAAAVGKHYRMMFSKLNHKCKHLQILNPKDSLTNYDVVLIPEHDQVQGANVINYLGSIHPYSPEWFKEHRLTETKYLAIMLGNPTKDYFQHGFNEEIQSIRTAFPQLPLYFCGSPRLNQQIKKQITTLLAPNDQLWLSSADGINPYEMLLKTAHKFFVTSDSINMINECCQSHVPVSILAKPHTPSLKHIRYINSIQSRLTALAEIENQQTVNFAVKQILSQPNFQKLLQTQF